MGRKVHPFIFRLGSVTNWKPRWFSKKQYREFLEQDTKLRIFVMEKLKKASVNLIEIERSANSLNIIIKTARPGLVIGRGGEGIEKLKNEIKSLLQKNSSIPLNYEIRLEVEEVKDPDIQATIVGMEIASQIERRLPYRRVIKQSLDKIMQNKKAKGAKIMIKGRLNGAEIARKEHLKKGKIPLQTLRSEIDYASSTAYTTYGTIGIKIWIYKGEIFN